MNEARVAYIPDTFYEVNGVALTSRQLEAFARRQQLPLLSIHGGAVTRQTEHGSVSILELQRGAASIALDSHLEYDPFLLRYARRVIKQIRAFRADLIHITGPGDMGMLGYYAAYKLKLPLVMSWHTSLHEYAARRLERLLDPLGESVSKSAGKLAERCALAVLRSFYRRARVVLAPNSELVDHLHQWTKRPAFLMERGVDTTLFTPARRSHATHPFRIGYVGRLTPEKNVRLLAALGHALQREGRAFEIVIVGQGNEEEWLRKNVPCARLTGVLHGESLAEAYADMDLFAFPSNTDTFGNVILESFASGVPAVVMNGGGPKFLVQQGITGLIASSEAEFCGAVTTLVDDPVRHAGMRHAARQRVCNLSWDSVFKTVFSIYGDAARGFALSDKQQVMSIPLLSSRVHERSRS